ncbi:MAG: C-terminal binding protein [Acidobacteria bacterium]|nr:C-terminal binding protein [Acidobacteriota bacterium]
MAETGLILHTDRDQPVDPSDLEAFGRHGARLQRVDTPEQFLEFAPAAVAVLNSNFRITASLIAALDRCRVISRYGSGYDNIDLQAAARKGIPVTNVPVFCVEEVANRAFTLLLALSCDLLKLDRAARAGVWGVHNLPFASQLEGCTLGLVGFGKIARAVARRARLFGLELVAYDPYVSAAMFAGEGARRSGLEELLRISDYVSLHTPLNAETRHLIGWERLCLMKPTAFLINTSRGAAIEESALVRALEERRIAGAGLDVFEREPPARDNPLFARDDVILTPHCAAHTARATEKVRREAVDSVLCALRGEPPVNVVNQDLMAAASRS